MGLYKHLSGTGRFAVVDELNKHFRGILADSKALLLNCAQWHLQILAIVMAADADQAELFGESQPAIQRRLHGSDGDRIARGKHRVWR